jgi:lambda family phage portal protein
MKTGDRVLDVLTGGGVTRRRVARVAAKVRARNERVRANANAVKVQARYEAAFWNRSRSYLPGFIQNARDDINALSRQEVLRRVRYFEKNSPVMLKILSLMDVNVIGSGITPSPATASASWNKEALQWWEQSFANSADMAGHLDLYGMQGVAYRAERVDGDHFIRLRTVTGRPALELIEADRIGTGGIDVGKLQRDGYKVVDGVQVEIKTGRPVAYLVADDFDRSKIEIVPASEMVPLFKKTRAGQYRGISVFHAAILDLHDLDDLQKYEMRAAKDAASISKIVELAQGALPSDGVGIGASLQDAQTQQEPAARQALYRQVLGGETLVTDPGDKYTQFMSERPSAATTGFWDKLDQKIVQGSGISYAALVDYKGNWGGATLRAAVQSDNRLYNLETLREARAWQRVWEFAVEWAIKRREIAPSADFRNVRWHPPRRTTVDIGNDSAAMIEELKGGLRTYEVIYGENGEDWKERIEQRAKEEQFIDQMSDKYGVPAARIASFAQERLAGMAPDAVGPQPGGPGAPGGIPQPAQNGKKGNQSP